MTDERLNSYRQAMSPRAMSEDSLIKAGIPFTQNRDGVRLMIEFNDGVIDFWPESQLWLIRSTAKKGQGVESLIKQVLG